MRYRLQERILTQSQLFNYEYHQPLSDYKML